VTNAIALALIALLISRLAVGRKSKAERLLRKAWRVFDLRTTQLSNAWFLWNFPLPDMSWQNRYAELYRTLNHDTRRILDPPMPDRGLTEKQVEEIFKIVLCGLMDLRRASLEALVVQYAIYIRAESPR
jgi:hypothetical protein